MSQEKGIQRRRGDTKPIQLTIREDGAVKDITDCTFLLGVNALSEPTDDDDPEFVLVGAIYGLPANGVVRFPMTPTQADRVGTYYYDVQLTDADGAVDTPLHGLFVMVQDRTKSNPLHIWTPDMAAVTPVDDVDVPYLGEDFWWVDGQNNGSVTLQYQTRDTEAVIRITGTNGGGAPIMYPNGVNSMQPFFPNFGVHEFTIECYLSGAMDILFGNSHGDGSVYLENTVYKADGDISIYLEGYDKVGDDFMFDDQGVGGGYPTAPGWVCFKFLVDQENKRLAGKHWAGRIADEPDGVWKIDLSTPDDDQGTIAVPNVGMGGILFAPLVSDVLIMDLRTWKWERVG
ncbi:MAG: hypothetical protein DRJ50_00780 [Actinobacteria bacterium]|nr:MAG: hypothetical protein DRJ50_00780 [Actinomycetota bacterium]